MNLEQAFQQCLQTEWKGTAGEVTATINGQSAVDFFGGTSKLKTITTSRLDRYVQHLYDRKLSPSTVNRKLMALSKILRFAHRRGELATLPHFPQQREPQGRLRWLTDEEERAVLGFLWGRQMNDHADAVMFLVDTGLRPSELWRARPADVKDGVLLIPISKTDLPRAIPLTQRAATIWRQRCALLPDSAPFPFSNTWMAYGWELAKRNLGLGNDKEFLVYALRHTCASRLLQRGISLPVVAKWLGHRDLKTTMRYAHLCMGNLQAARQVLEQQEGN